MVHSAAGVKACACAPHSSVLGPLFFNVLMIFSLWKRTLQFATLQIMPPYLQPIVVEIKY